MKKKKLLLLELCLLCMATSGFKTKESEPLYVGIADVNKEADLGFKDYLDVYSYADMKRMVNDKKIKKYENEIESITERYSNIYGIKSNLINKIIENNTDNYKKMVDILKDYLKFDEEGNKRIYAPSVIAVKDGEILDFDDETAWDTKGYKTPEEYWKNEDLEGLKEKLAKMFEETKTNICTSDCNK